MNGAIRLSLSLAVLTGVIALLAACGPSSGPQGAVKVAASRSALGVSADRAALTISSGDGTEFPPIVAPLTPAGEGFEGYVSDVPAGAGRQFEIDVYDATGSLIARGTGKGDVAVGAVAEVAVLVEPWLAPLSPGLSMPVFDILAASATQVAPGGIVTLDAAAHDPDAVGTVGYAWTATCGSFDAPESPAAKWTAPGQPGSCDLSLTVSDTAGGSVTVDLMVAVASGP